MGGGGRELTNALKLEVRTLQNVEQRIYHQSRIKQSLR